MHNFGRIPTAGGVLLKPALAPLGLWQIGKRNQQGDAKGRRDQQGGVEHGRSPFLEAGWLRFSRPPCRLDANTAQARPLEYLKRRWPDFGIIIR